MLEELSIACKNDCAAFELPQLTEPCDSEVWNGRVNEILFVPCTEEIDEAWVADLANWTANFVGPTTKGRRTLKGIGSFQQVNATAVDTGANCGVATLEGVKATWELLFRSIIIDKTSAFETHNFANELAGGALKNYKLFARFCDAPDTILPIGKVALSAFNNILPEGVEEFMTINYGFQWKQRGVPMPVVVPGIDGILK
jgi:hypothetical protein